MLNNPVGIAVDAAGSIYIADSNNSRIRKVNPDGNIVTIAGRGGSGYSGDNGSATSAVFSFPRGLTIDSAGKVYIADTQNSVVRVLTPTFPTITAGGIGNAASFAARLSPGALATVFGTGFGNATVQPDAPLPNSVSGVSVNINGSAAPIYSSARTDLRGASPRHGQRHGECERRQQQLSPCRSPAAATACEGAAVVQNSDGLNDLRIPSRGGTIIAIHRSAL
jgi:hypothetical protein